MDAETHARNAWGMLGAATGGSVRTSAPAWPSTMAISNTTGPTAAHGGNAGNG